MKTLYAIAVSLCLATVTAFGAQQASTGAQDQSAPSVDATPAEQRIDAARHQIASDPKRVQAFNDLAAAYVRRAREARDTKFLADAEAALSEGFKLDPADFQLQKTEVSLILARGEFAQAKEKATALNRRTPDDVMVYGYLAEAEIGLGDYDAATANAQWMMNMLPNDVPALMIGARLRAHFGDPTGAIEFLNLAYNETSPSEAEELAWIANQIAAIEIDTGKADAAIEVLNQAEQTFPHYPYTRDNLAKAQRAHATGAAGTSAKQAGIQVASTGVESQPHNGDEPAAPGQDSRNVEFSPVPAELTTPRRTDTDRRIRKAQALATANPKDAKALAALGAAYAQRARETGDVSDYERAEQALNRSLDLTASDFSADAALETMAEVCMGEHRFNDALQFAQKALALGSGSLSPFAIVGDASADMGEYDKASEAYNKMAPPGMPLSPRTGYARDSRLAYIDFIQGDTRGAIRRMNEAVEEGSQTSIPGENLAWLYFELGEFDTQAGAAADANAAYLTALKIHPGDYRALAGMARLRAAHGRFDEAIDLYRKAIAVVPMPQFVSELGDLYEKTGQHDEARKQYDLVAYIGLLGSVNQVLHNRDLAQFYADHDTRLAEALQLARKEFEVRHDVYTWDTLAWALFKNINLTDASKASDEALKYGTRDAVLLFHAGMIAGKLGHADQARSHLRAVLDINPNFSLRYSAEAERELARLDAAVLQQQSEAGNAR